MTKEITISMKGVQVSTDGESDTIELMADGEYFLRNGKHYVIFEEMVEGSGEIIKTNLKISKDSLEVNKKGALSTRMVYELGKKNMSSYHTPFGVLLMGIETSMFYLREEEGAIDVKLAYGLEADDNPVAECTMEIRIRPAS